MPRTSRRDTPGSWHHVLNRAVDGGTLFERREDFRRFAASLAYAVRRGEIEVHAYCLMGAYYHLLLRSPAGALGLAMHRIQLAYSRWFNRSRGRDGRLVRGRYSSRPVTSLVYRRALVHYIDSSPSSMGLARDPAGYPHGSAVHHARSSGPAWLERSWIEGTVASMMGVSTDPHAAYERAFGCMPPGMADIVEARLSSGSELDPLDSLVAASSDQIRAWLEEKARQSDRNHSLLPVMAFGRLEELVAARRKDTWTITRGRIRRDAWPVVLAGLGRGLCGASLAGLTRPLGVSHTTTTKLCRLHEQEVRRGGEYSARVAELTHGALQEWRDVGSEAGVLTEAPPFDDERHAAREGVGGRR